MNQSDGNHHVKHLRNLIERTAPFVEHGTFSEHSLSFLVIKQNKITLYIVVHSFI